MEISKAKRKRISKKNKSAWRKTDVQDVEKFLEEQRQEERIGTFSDKKNEELFLVDATPSKQKPNVYTEKQKRKLNASTKQLRSFQALVNSSKVQDPILKRNHVKQKVNGRNIEEEIRNPTKPRHIKANKDRNRYNALLEKRLQAKKTKNLNTTKDIWQDTDFRDSIPGLKDEKGWISKDLSLHVAGNIGKKVVKTHDSVRHRTTKAKKFEPPHPGMSYNPSAKAYQELLAKVVQHETKVIKQEQHLKRVTTSMFSKVTLEERDKRRIMEMSAEIVEDDENAENKLSDEHKTENNDYTTSNLPVENKKKSKQARNKELKQKELERQQKLKKALKKQIADINRIKSLKAEVRAEEEKLNAIKKHRKRAALKKKFEPKRLGRNKFVEPEIDFTMPQDIAGNLRNVKTETDLITDRFKSFQKRNIIPTTVAVTRKKAKIKRFVRNSHKDPGISFQQLRESRKAATKKAELDAKATIKL